MQHEHAHHWLCFLTSASHFLNRKPIQFPWQRRILVLYSHLSVTCTFGSIWTLFSRHLRNNLGIITSWQYKQIKLSINKPQKGGRGALPNTHRGTASGPIPICFLAMAGIRRSLSFLRQTSTPWCEPECGEHRPSHIGFSTCEHTLMPQKHWHQFKRQGWNPCQHPGHTQGRKQQWGDMLPGLGEEEASSLGGSTAPSCHTNACSSHSNCVSAEGQKGCA